MVMYYREEKECPNVAFSSQVTAATEDKDEDDI
jgi:hypothetical protein